MANLGSASLASSPTTQTSGTYAPYQGVAIGSAALVEFSGGGGAVDPKRYLNVSGTATAIQ